jgi:hypothetical protein
MTISEAVNSLNFYNFYKQVRPEAAMFKFAEEHDIDLMYMALSRPELYSIFARIGPKLCTLEGAYLWDNYRLAYEQLEEMDAFTTATRHADAMVYSVVDRLTELYKADLRVPLEEVENCITYKRKAGQTSISLDIREFIDVINLFYKINMNDILGVYLGEFDYVLMTTLGYDAGQMAVLNNTKPADSMEAAAVSLLDSHIQKTSAKYLNFWHHLLDTDFLGSSVDSNVTLYSQPPETVRWNSYTDTQKTIYSTLRNIVFKELNQLPYFGGVTPTEIVYDGIHR